MATGRGTGDEASSYTLSEGPALPTVFALQQQLDVEKAKARTARVKSQDVKVPFRATNLRAFRKEIRDATGARATRKQSQGGDGGRAAAEESFVAIDEHEERLHEGSEAGTSSKSGHDGSSGSRRQTLLEREELRRHVVRINEHEHRRRLCSQGKRSLSAEIAEMEMALAELKAQAVQSEEHELMIADLGLEERRKATERTDADKKTGKCEAGTASNTAADENEDEVQQMSRSLRYHPPMFESLVPRPRDTKLMSGIRGDSALLQSEIESRLSSSALVDIMREATTVSDSNVDSISAQVENMTNFMDAMFHSTTSLVAQMSGETGQLCEVMRSKYYDLLATVVEVNRKLCTELGAERAKRRASDAIHVLQSRVVDKQQAQYQEVHQRSSDLESAVRSLEEGSEAERTKHDAAVSELTKANRILEGEVKHYQLLLAKADESKEHAMAKLASSYAAELDEAQRERSDLEQQMIYLKKQVARTLRDSLIIRGPPVVHADVQTDDNVIIIETKKGYDDESGCVGTGVGEIDDIDNLVVDAVKKNMTNSATKGDGGGSQEENNSLGPFRQYVLLRRQGTVRPLPFVLRCVAQIYYDLQLSSEPAGEAERGARAMEDSASAARRGSHRHRLRISDRMVNSGNFALCIYNWFLGMHGIRQVAETHLIDFLASVSHYQGQSTKLLQFSKLCGLYDEWSDWNSFDIIEMYLSCITALCPEGIIRFFTGSSSFVYDGTFKITPFDALSSLPKIFRELERPDLLQAFVDEKVMPLMSEQNASAIDGDELVNVLVTEFIQRRNRTKSKLEATVLMVQQEVPEEQQTYSSIMEFERMLDEDVVLSSASSSSSSSSASARKSAAVTSPKIAGQQKQQPAQGSRTLFGQPLELFSASLRTSNSNKLLPAAVARAALNGGIINLMKAHDLRRSEVDVAGGSTSVPGAGVATKSQASEAECTSVAADDDYPDVGETHEDEINDEDVENLVCDNLRVILNGVVELRNESFDDSFKALLEHGASPEDGDLIHDLAELNSQFKSALRDMCYETSSEYALNSDLKAKRNNSVTAYGHTNYKYDYEVNQSGGAKHGGINTMTTFDVSSSHKVTNLADVQHAWRSYRKLVHRLSNCMHYFDGLNNKQNNATGLSLMKNNVNIASRMTDQRGNRGNSVTSMLHSGDGGNRKFSMERANRASMARHNSTYFSHSSFSQRVSELDRVKESGGSDYLAHQQQQFQIQRSKQHSMFAPGKEHQKSVYAHKNSEADSSFGQGIGQHTSALITLLQ